MASKPTTEEKRPDTLEPVGQGKGPVSGPPSEPFQKGNQSEFGPDGDNPETKVPEHWGIEGEPNPEEEGISGPPGPANTEHPDAAGTPLEEPEPKTSTNQLFFHEGIRIFSEAISTTTGVNEPVVLECLGRAMDTLQHGHGLECKLVDSTHPLNPFGEPFIELPERYAFEQLTTMLPQYEWQEYDGAGVFDFEARGKRVRDTEDRNIQTKFTPEEVAEISKRAAQQNLQLLTLEEEKKEAMADYTGRIKALKNEINMKLGLVRQEYEYKNYECYKILDFQRGKVYYQDVHTAKYVEVRDMNASERQLEMEFSSQAPEAEVPFDPEILQAPESEGPQMPEISDTPEQPEQSQAEEPEGAEED